MSLEKFIEFLENEEVELFKEYQELMKGPKTGIEIANQIENSYLNYILEKAYEFKNKKTVIPEPIYE